MTLRAVYALVLSRLCRAPRLGSSRHRLALSSGTAQGRLISFSRIASCMSSSLDLLWLFITYGDVVDAYQGRDKYRARERVKLHASEFALTGIITLDAV